MGASEVRALRAGGIPLSGRLNDGYDPKDGVQRPLEGRARAVLPKALRSLTDDLPARRELTALQVAGQQQAARLKSPALRAAYLESIEAWKNGAGQDALRRRLEVAQREKNRFFADRIAQTELHRAHQEQVAAELMADAQTTVVQVRMNPNHPKTDVCDMHARADLFRLGPGNYPKAKAPRPPFHVFCRCRLRSRPSLDAADARPVPGGEAEFLRGLPPEEAGRVMGSRERAARVLNGESVVAVVDAGKAEAFRTARVGEGAGHPLVRENAVMLAHHNALPGADRAVIDRNKLAGYALNKDHETGAHKARVFASVLGMTREHVAELDRQIRAQLATLPATERTPNKFGRSFSVNVPITGPTGSGIVKTAWILDIDSDAPRLVSAYVVR